MQEGQLHGIANLLDLPSETTDVLVPHIGHLFEHEIFDLGLRDTLEGVSGLGVDQQRVTWPQPARRLVRVVRGFLGGHLVEWLGEPDDALLVGVPDDQSPSAVTEKFTQGADLADLLERSSFDDGQRLVETNRLSGREFDGLDVG